MSRRIAEPPSSTAAVIKQTKPFRSVGQEGVIALLLAGEALQNRLADFFAAYGELTCQQYNVLRILRGAGPDGLPTLEIVERMIERTPGITRLLDRLEEKGFISRERPDEDRRRVIARATDKALDLLKTIDPEINRVEDESFGCFSEEETATMAALLARLREHLVQR